MVTLGDRTSLVKEAARAAGFDRVGVTLPVAPPHAEFLDEWLGRGYAGRMDYLRRHADLRRNPTGLLPGARSIICVAMNYARNESDADWTGELAGPRGRVALYAWGEDYHVVVRRRLDDMVRRLKERLKDSFQVRPFVDTAPVLEKPLAAAAGLGWIGKNTLLIAPRLGSFVFLGGLVTTLELEPDEPVSERCGRCRRCMDACPTGAIVQPHVLDARRCLSYLTIEHREAILPELRAFMGDWVFGCDVCQRACPHNRVKAMEAEPSRCVRATASAVSLSLLLNLARDEYLSLTRGNALRRAKLTMLRRNAAIALGNTGGQDALTMLRYAVQSGDPLVAEHALWAIDRIRQR